MEIRRPALEIFANPDGSMTVIDHEAKGEYDHNTARYTLPEPVVDQIFGVDTLWDISRSTAEDYTEYYEGTDTNHELAHMLYNAYGNASNWKTFDNRDMPDWDGIGHSVRARWMAVADLVRLTTAPVHSELTIREKLQVNHALMYERKFSDSGAPGHSQLLLIAKLARALGL